MSTNPANQICLPTARRRPASGGRNSVIPFILPLFLLGCLLGQPILPAQVVEVVPAGAGHLVSLGIGLEPHVTAAVQYARRITGGDGPHQSYVGVGVKVPPLLLDGRHWRLHLAWMNRWQFRDHWAVTLNALPYLAGARNSAGAMTGLGLELRGLTAHYGKNWTNGIDLGWQGTLLTYVRHSANARNTFRDRYPGGRRGEEPVSGWYRFTAQRFRIGWMGARKINPRLALQFNVGGLFSIQKQGILLGFSHGQFPVYAETAVTAALDHPNH